MNIYTCLPLKIASRVLANATAHVYVWCMHADFLFVFFVSVGRVFCVCRLLQHISQITTHICCALLCFISFHLVFMCTLNTLSPVRIRSMCFLRMFFWLLGYKWTSNAGTYRDFIFECWPKHVNQHLLHSDSATQKEVNGEERKACVWQRWKCVAEKRSIECCYTIQHFTSVWSLVDYRYVCMYFCHFACSAASKFMHVQFVENKRRTEMQAPFGTAHPRWVFFNLQNLNEHSIYILGAHFVYWNRRKRMGEKIEIF